MNTSSVPTVAIALFRNVSLGQIGSPSRTDLESAFEQAGATAAQSFQSNGTVVFRSLRPRPCLDEAVSELRAGGMPDLWAALISPADLVAVLEALPPASLPDGAYREMVTFFAGRRTIDPLPPDGPKVRFVSAGPGWVHSLIWKDGDDVGNPGQALDRHIDDRTTTRTRDALEALAAQIRPGP